MLLGGSEAQLIAIDKAKELGYYTVLCDYLPDNPGQHIADKFYLVSTTDKDAVLAVAKIENIDGIVAYSSDPAAPTAAYVSNKMNLPGPDYDVVRQLCEKQLFRKFLRENNFAVPNSVEIKIPYDITYINLKDFNYPVIVKPTDSSGSKGITVINSRDELERALKSAEKFSRNRTLIIEEFIERDHQHVIEAEIFVKEGEVVSWGLINSIRDKEANPLLPSAYSYPISLTAKRKRIVKEEIQRFVNATGIKSGAFNIEMILDKNNRLYFLDAGPRNGGNRLPEFISMISEKDVVGATIKNAMGENDFDVDLDGENGGYWGLGVLHSLKKGKFKGVSYSELAKKRLLRTELNISVGDEVNPFLKCNDLIGLDFFHFETKEEMEGVMEKMNDSIQVIV